MGDVAQQRVTRVAVVGVCLAVLVAVFAATRGDDGHEVVVDAASASGVIVGMDVKAAGRDVGRVKEARVTRRHRARLVLELDDRVWPLPADSRMQLRTGGTIKFTDRHIDLRPGTSRRVLREGGTLPAGRFTVPVEFDELFGTFDAKTRRGLRATLDTGGAVLGRAKEELGATLDAAPPAVRQA
ncbi:MAG: hypothetical protein JWM84_4049, partial [Nocardioides sp.]|nr:hypothetical protein [Nocardioides sp.]